MQMPTILIDWDRKILLIDRFRLIIAKHRQYACAESTGKRRLRVAHFRSEKTCRQLQEVTRKDVQK